MCPNSLPRPARWPTLLIAALVAGCDSPAERVFVVNTNAPSRSGLVAAGAGALVGNEAGALVLVDGAGVTVWSASLSREISERPAATQETVVAASVGGEWVGLSLADGRERWRLTERVPPATKLVADKGRVFMLGVDSAVRAVEATSGAVAWTSPLAAKGRLTSAAAPVLAGGSLVVASDDTLVALELETGKVKWKRLFAKTAGLLEVGSKVLALGSGGTLMSLTAADGKAEWTRELGSAVSSGPSFAVGAVWVGLENGALLQLDPGDGHEVWRAALPSPLRAAVAEARGLVLVPTSGREGKLVALRPGQPKPFFELRVDSPLRTGPVMLGEVVVFTAADGRVLGFRIRASKPVRE
jgi:outer membrane protein assembly factor BamB